MGKETDAGDFLAAIVAGIEERDHKLLVIDGNGIAPEVAAQLEADGYVFGYAAPAEDGRRRVYFVRTTDPAPRM